MSGVAAIAGCVVGLTAFVVMKMSKDSNQECAMSDHMANFYKALYSCPSWADKD